MFDEDQVIPPDLDSMPPGPVLAAFLSGIEVGSLSGHDRVVVLRAHQRLVSHFQARVFEDIASISALSHDRWEDMETAEKAAAAEIGLALHLTRRAAGSDLSLAHDLKQRLPRVWEALSGGVIDLRRARVITHGVTHLPEGTARRVVNRVIGDAPRLTTGQLAARLRRECIAVDPDQAQTRYQTAVGERRVVVEATEEGTANLLGLDLPAEAAAAATSHIDHLARRLKTRHETRSLDQLRADVFLDLLTGTSSPGCSHSTRGGVEIRADLTTLTRLSENPGDLAGFGPVIADITRQIVANQHDAEWRYTITHPDTGAPLHVGTTRRRPTPGQARTVRARYPTCVWPGCRLPAIRSDLDHTIPWAVSGTTHTRDLVPLCRHHHRIRHIPGFGYRTQPDGDVVWTTPTDHTYTTSGRSP